MSLHNEGFARLRQILVQPPSTKTWLTLIHVLQTWESDDLPHALEYASQHLEHWPDQYRMLDHIGADTSPWPLARHLRVTAIVRPALHRIFHQTTLSHLKMLSLLHTGLDAEDFSWLCNARELSQLHTLVLHDNRLRLDRHIELFCAAACAQQLEALHLGRNHYGTRTLEGLVDSGIFRRLHTFSTKRSQVWNEPFCRLFATVETEALRVLALPGCHISDKEFAILLEAPAMAQVEHLDLAHNHVSGSSLTAIAAATHLRRIKTIDLRRSTRMSYVEYELLRDATIYQLLQSPVGQRLEGIWVDTARLSAGCQEALTAHNTAPQPPL